MEILMVILIISVISAVIYAAMSSVQDQATMTKARAFSAVVKNSLAESVVGSWSLSEGTGTSVADLSEYAKTGTVNGAAVWITNSNQCISGSCLQFNGDDSWIALGTLPAQLTFTSTDPWTFELWMNWDMTGRSDSTVFYAGTGAVSPNVMLRASGNNRFAYRDGAGNYHYFASGSSNAYLNKWTYLAWSSDGTGHLYLYVNGILFGDLGSPTLLTNSAMSFTTFARGYSTRSAVTYPANTYYFKGMLDEIAIYKSVITASKAKSDYYAGVNKMLAKKMITADEYKEKILETDNVAKK